MELVNQAGQAANQKPLFHPPSPSECACTEYVNDQRFWGTCKTFKCAVHGLVTLDRRALPTPAPHAGTFNIPMKQPGNTMTFPSGGDFKGYLSVASGSTTSVPPVKSGLAELSEVDWTKVGSYP